MLERILSNDRMNTLRPLMLLATIGGAALGGAMYEAGHGNAPGAAAYIGLGFLGMSGVGVSVNRRQNSN